MQLIQGHVFKVEKPKMEFKAGETYRIYRIAPLKDIDKVRYTFYSKAGNIEIDFDSTAHAEMIIAKMSRKN